jgi:hypothetical protein
MDETLRNLLTVLALIIAMLSGLMMPFVLFILAGIRSSMANLYNLIHSHTRDDNEVAERVAVLENRINRVDPGGKSR